MESPSKNVRQEEDDSFGGTTGGRFSDIAVKAMKLFLMSSGLCALVEGALVARRAGHGWSQLIYLKHRDRSQGGRMQCEKGIIASLYMADTVGSQLALKDSFVDELSNRR